jgi:hypothetical protein
MYCSLVSFDGAFRQKPKDYEYQEVAESAGVSFIKVRHVKGFGITTASQRGFQGVRVVALPGRLGVGRYKVEYSKNHLGKDVSAMLPLDFVSDRKTMELSAIIPDTEFNRRKLAACYYHVPFCAIVDKEIEKDVQERANELEKILPKQKPVEEVVVEYATENERLKTELAKEKALRASSEQNAEVVAVARDRIKRERCVSNEKANTKASEIKKKIADHYNRLNKTKKESKEEKDGDNPAIGQSD